MAFKDKIDNIIGEWLCQQGLHILDKECDKLNEAIVKIYNNHRKKLQKENKELKKAVKVWQTKDEPVFCLACVSTQHRNRKMKKLLKKLQKEIKEIQKDMKNNFKKLKEEL